MCKMDGVQWLFFPFKHCLWCCLNVICTIKTQLKEQPNLSQEGSSFSLSLSTVHGLEAHPAIGQSPWFCLNNTRKQPCKSSVPFHSSKPLGRHLAFPHPPYYDPPSRTTCAVGIPRLLYIPSLLTRTLFSTLHISGSSSFFRSPYPFPPQRVSLVTVISTSLDCSRLYYQVKLPPPLREDAS